MATQFKVWELFFDWKTNEAIKYRIIRDICNLFQQEKEDYHKQIGAANFQSRNYIEYQSNGDKNYHLKNILIKLDQI